jgi:hypothetical protein
VADRRYIRHCRSAGAALSERNGVDGAEPDRLPFERRAHGSLRRPRPLPALECQIFEARADRDVAALVGYGSGRPRLATEKPAIVSTVISAIIFASGFIVCPVLRQRASKRNANGASAVASSGAP